MSWIEGSFLCGNTLDLPLARRGLPPRTEICPRLLSERIDGRMVYTLSMPIKKTMAVRCGPGPASMACEEPRSPDRGFLLLGWSRRPWNLPRRTQKGPGPYGIAPLW
jgi:hypothetical protein